MNRMSDMSEAALMELLRRPRSPSSARLVPASTTADGEDTAADEIATCREHEAAPDGCDDLYAPYDLTALQEGQLSADGIRRLARHVARCATCQIAVAMIVAEAAPAESTGTHMAAPERDDRPRK